ncbi:MAG: TonB-dependent receptor [Acidobacteria bacterium]|nr:TonB-dependent receptor [Acidobacteriota bacterium]
MLILFLNCILLSIQGFAQDSGLSIPAQNSTAQNSKLLVTVADDNGLPVASARIALTRTETKEVVRCESDFAGRCELTSLSPGNYQLIVEKIGFYAVTSKDIQVGDSPTLAVTLNHEQEIRESIDVVNSPPAIDPAKTEAGETLTFREIINIPYTGTRDFRNVLPYTPRVVRDRSGQVHIDGSASYQINNQLDGFNLSHPVNGLLEARISPDALRSIEVKTSRYSPEYGKGSGGVIGLTTGMGDDRFRFSATDFLPAVQYRKGINLNTWTPRLTFSGPIRKHKAWFFNAIEGEYDLNIIEGLPENADRNNSWRLGNLAKAQINLTPSNILSGSFLFNRFLAGNQGLSELSPIETTRRLSQKTYLISLKDQVYRQNGMIMEFGVALNQVHLDLRPLGDQPFVIFPDGVRGSYFKSTEGLARRIQTISNVYLPAKEWHGRHEFKFGMGVDHVSYQDLNDRRPITLRRGDQSLSRQIDFIDNPFLRESNLEVSGYFQDRWSISGRFLAEVGFRLDWDKIIRSVLISPRMSGTYLLTADGNNKLSAGIGTFYDATNLELVTRPLAGVRVDQFFARDGLTPRGDPRITSFQVDQSTLKAPRYFNMSVGFERKLPASIYLRTDFVVKDGSNGLTFVNLFPQQPDELDSLFALLSQKHDRYTAMSVNIRKSFKEAYMIFASYTRSATRSNAIIDFNLENVLYGQQSGGPVGWDAPNRLIAWGLLPLIKKFDMAFAVEWRDGYPFSIVNATERLVGPANSFRFPDFFSLNLHAERRFRVFGVNLALRGGFNNITDRDNPSEVVNNIESGDFLTYRGFQGRTFVGRVRFLGRKK